MESERLDWVILTRGDRDPELDDAVRSLGTTSVTIVWNGLPGRAIEGANAIESETNLGVPGGRHLGLASTTAPFIGFLDDDARLRPGAVEAAMRAFAAPDVAVVCCRLTDDDGQTSRRHVPRLGSRGVGRAGSVATFLGGACIIRREAYEQAGGYWPELFYGHEELDLAWRLIDRGWRIEYVPESQVYHPRTEISRHQQGWSLTGRNRVAIARRNLPWPVAIVHTSTWLLIGIIRAPSAETRRGYVSGWRKGWRMPVERQAIGWAAVVRLSRLGRPPVV
jgi:GT2 family glycosyltransferase